MQADRIYQYLSCCILMYLFVTLASYHLLSLKSLLATEDNILGIGTSTTKWVQCTQVKNTKEKEHT